MRRLFHIRFVRPAALALLVGMVLVLGMSGTAWAGLGEPGEKHKPSKHGTVPPREADLSVSTSGRWSGDDVTFTIHVSNKGPVVANNAGLSDSFSDDLSYRSVSSSKGRCKYEHGGISCDLGNLSAGDDVNIVIKARVKNRSTKSVFNSARVESLTDDPNYTNNVARTTVKRPS